PWECRSITRLPWEKALAWFASVRRSSGRVPPCPRAPRRKDAWHVEKGARLSGSCRGGRLRGDGRGRGGGADPSRAGRRSVHGPLGASVDATLRTHRPDHL